MAVALIVNRHALYVLVPSEVEGLAERAREDVLERRNAGPQMPHLHAVAGRELEEQLRRPIFRHEDAHHIPAVAVALEAFRTERLGKTRVIAFHAKLER